MYRRDRRVDGSVRNCAIGREERERGATLPDDLRARTSRKRGGAPGGSRTPGLQVRSLSLYPAELRARVGPFYFFADVMNASISFGARGAPADITFGSPVVISTSSSIRTPMPSYLSSAVRIVCWSAGGSFLKTSLATTSSFRT